MRPSTLLSFGLGCGLLVAAACGKVQSTTDGGNGGTDAPSGPDADPHGVVTVTVLNTDQSGTAVQGIPVVFFNPDGEMVGKSDSDANGMASATVLPGANVSVVWPKGATSYQIATIYAIKPGDNLSVGFRTPSTTDVATFQVSFDPYAGAASYQIYGPCGLADGNNVLHFQAGCKQDPFDVYVLALDQSQNVLASNAKNGVALSAGSANLPAASWTFSQQFTASYSNVPATVTGIDAEHVAGFPGGFTADANGTPANGTLSLALTTPTPGTYAWVESTISGPSGGQQEIRQRIAGASTTNGMDVTATLLPWLSAPALDVPSQTINVVNQGSGTYDTYLADVQYERGTGSTAIFYEWITLGPTIGPVKLPTLPSDVGNVNPQATDTVQNAIALAIDDDGTGWDSVRDHIFDEFRAALAGVSTSQQLRITITQTVD